MRPTKLDVALFALLVAWVFGIATQRNNTVLWGVVAYLLLELALAIRSMR